MNRDPTTSDPVRIFTGFQQFLSDAEVAFLCRPLTQPAAQCRYLQRLGYRFHRRPDGTPVVWRQEPQPNKAGSIRWTK